MLPGSPPSCCRHVTNTPPAPSVLMPPPNGFCVSIWTPSTCHCAKAVEANRTNNVVGSMRRLNMGILLASVRDHHLARDGLPGGVNPIEVHAIRQQVGVVVDVRGVGGFGSYRYDGAARGNHALCAEKRSKD